MNKKEHKRTIGEMREKFTICKHSNSYQFEIQTFLNDVGLTDEDPITCIDNESMHKWVDVMFQRGLRPASIRHYIVCLRVFTNFCGIDVHIKLPKLQEEQLKFYTDEELSLLLKKSKKSFIDHRSYVIIAFILSTGARASTIINIKLEDLDLKNREVYYRHLKNKKTAIIPLPDSLVNVIREYLMEWDIKEYLFPDRSNNQLTVSALRQSINRYCVRRGVKPKSIHSFRHSFSRLYIKNGGDSITLMRYLTHSSIDMSRRYCVLFGDDLRQATRDYIPFNKLSSEGTKIHRKLFY